MNTFIAGRLTVPFSFAARDHASHAHIVISPGKRGSSCLDEKLSTSDMPYCKCCVHTAPTLKELNARYSALLASDSCSNDVSVKSVPVLTVRTNLDRDVNEVVVVSFVDRCDAVEVALQWPDAEIVRMDVTDIVNLGGNLLRLPVMVVATGYPRTPLADSLYRRVTMFHRHCNPVVPELYI